MITTLLKDGTFTLRAVTRNASSEAAQNLQVQGVETVEANLRDLGSLRKAISGSECVFGVTQFSLDPDFNETQLGKNLADVCKEHGVKLLIWSSLPDVTADSGGKYTHVSHFDSKARVEEYLGKIQVPHAIVRTGYFLENLIMYEHLQKTDSPDKLIYSVPLSPGTTHQVITWVEHDVGLAVLALCKNYQNRPGDVLGQTFIAARTELTFDELCAAFGEVLGKEIKSVSGPATGVAAVDEMCLHIKEFGMHRQKPIPDPKLIALGVDYSMPITEFARELKKHGF